MKSALVVALALAAVWPVERMDLAVRERVQAGRGPAFEGAMRLASRVGPPVVLGGLLALAAFGGAPGVATARLGIAALIPTNLVVEGLKWTVQRTRPDGTRDRANSSFPSSHAANAAALAVVLSSRWRRAWPLWWILAITAAWSRIYLDRHYLSDVLVGLGLGAALALAVVLWMRGRAPAPGPGGPGGGR